MSNTNLGPQPQVVYVERSAEPKNGLGLAALILGVFGVAAGLIPFLFWAAMGLGFLAALLGLIAVRRKRQGRATNGKTAWASIISGLTAFSLGIWGATIVFGAVNDAVNSLDSEVNNNAQVVVTEGAAFTHDGYAVAKGWKVATDEFGSTTIKGLTVTNVSHDGDDTPMFTFALYKGDTVLGEIEANGNSLEHGKSSKMDAGTLDDMHGVPAFTKITVKDMW
jgi:hypothetical protein